MKNDIPILGIDLGTTNSAIAIWDPEQKQAVLLPYLSKHAHQAKKPLNAIKSWES